MTKKLCKAGHGGMKDFADLTLQDGVLVHQVAALAAEELDGDVEVRPGGFAQPEAVGGGPPDGGEVGVVGLVVGIGGLAILLGRERMDEAGVEAGLTKRQLDGAMIVAGAFDGDDDILEVVLAHGLTDAVDDGLEVAARVRHGGGFEEGAAVEVGEEVARSVPWHSRGRRCRSVRVRPVGRGRGVVRWVFAGRSPWPCVGDVLWKNATWEAPFEKRNTFILNPKGKVVQDKECFF